MNTESKSWRVTIDYGNGHTVDTTVAGIGLQTRADVEAYAKASGGTLAKCESNDPAPAASAPRETL